MAKRRRTDNTMAKRRRTDNTMAKRRRTDNTMAKRRKGQKDKQRWVIWCLLFILEGTFISSSVYVLHVYIRRIMWFIFKRAHIDYCTFDTCTLYISLDKIELFTLHNIHIVYHMRRIYHSFLPSWPYGSLIYNYLCNQWLSRLKSFSPGTPVPSNNKTDRHDITEILLKVLLNTNTYSLYREWITSHVHLIVSY